MQFVVIFALLTGHRKAVRRKPWCSVLAVYLAVFILLYTAIYRLFTWWRKREGEPHIQTNVTVLSILIFLINQTSQMFIVIDENYDWHNVELRLYSIIVCALALSVQFGLFHSNRLQRENETIRLLLQSEQKQHALEPFSATPGQLFMSPLQYFLHWNIFA
ncbi:MAG: hypothetical protein LUG47_08730 [Clostridiales bacterium]|nr:hypothetical protein [Clostridiales bacterium]